MSRSFVFVLCLLLALSATPVTAAEPDLMSAQAAHTQAVDGDVLLIDIRSPEEWRQTGIGEGAHTISMHEPGFIEKIEALTGGDKSKRLALICARGVRSSIMSAQLRRFGYTRIVDVGEGMLGSGAGPGWLKASLPVRPFGQ